MARVQQNLVVLSIPRLQQHARVVFYWRANWADQRIHGYRSATRARSRAITAACAQSGNNVSAAAWPKAQYCGYLSCHSIDVW